MKNKKLVYLLGFLVLAVWGMIIYRIFAAMDHDEDTPVQTTTAPSAKEPYDDYAAAKDTSHLLANYRDPFSKEVKKDTTTLIVHHIVKPITVIPSIGINWNFIKYSGYVRNPGSKKLVAIVIINGKNTMLQEGETQEKVKLLKNMQDSIKICFNGATKFIKLDNNAL